MLLLWRSGPRISNRGPMGKPESNPTTGGMRGLRLALRHAIGGACTQEVCQSEAIILNSRLATCTLRVSVQSSHPLLRMGGGG